jgi:chorismate mutase/prephenate dehydratase
VTDAVTRAREEIDAIDRSLLTAVNRRLELVRKLHEHKRATGIPLRDPGREQAMIAELQGRNEGPLSDDGVAELVQFVLGLTRKELYGEP